MIDPTNTEPIPVHTPHIRRTLSALVIIVLAILAVAFVLRDIDFSPTPEVVVVPPPSETGESVFPEDIQAEFATIKARVASGEISRGEGERLMTELFKKVPPPPPVN